MNQDWFEMKDVRRRRLATSVWIPLRAINFLERQGHYGFNGYKEEFFGAGSLAVPLDKKTATEKLGWSDVGISHEHASYIQDGRYVPSDVYENYDGEFIGIHLVLGQRVNRNEIREWHLHQDFVIALGLKREGDVWVSPDEGYIEVARLHRQEDGSSYLLEVRAEYLKDYLCARQMALYVTSYRKREFVVDDASYINWSENPYCEKNDGDRWEGRISEIHEGGHPFGSSMAVFHLSRTDVDFEEDVPSFGLPTDDNLSSESWTKEFEGRKLYCIEGELWRNEWIDPANISPRVKGDKPAATVFFITDAEGKRENKETLQDGGRWLWFRPDVIMALFHRRGGSLGWYTRDTGNVSCSPDYEVHFGVNQLGLVNVYAKDIALLPEWQQKIWAGYNVSPEGGVSEELLASQVKAIPADTQAPEEFLTEGFELLNNRSLAKLGFPLFREHDQIPQLLAHSHRFRAVDKAGLYSLAKDLARLTADSLDTAGMQKLVSPPKGTKWGSLKSLENLIASKIGPNKARSLLSPLVGIYELRHADAHLASSKTDEALALAKVDPNLPTIFQGYQLLHACVSCFYGIVGVLERWDAENSAD